MSSNIMSPSCCASRPPGRVRRVARFVSWIIPGAVLALMPKCPACLAAYIALGTGISLSFPVAENLRLGAIALSVASIGALVVGVALRIRHRNMAGLKG